MSRCFQPRRDPRKHFFPMPNEIFSMDLSAEEIALYAYLIRSWISCLRGSTRKMSHAS